MFEEDTAMSFQEWSDAGFLIMKGAKSEFRDAMGVPQFTRDQVRFKPVGTSYVPVDYANTPWQRPKGAPGPVPPPVPTLVPEMPPPRPEFTIPDPI
jgi:hypothetical protein